MCVAGTPDHVVIHHPYCLHKGIDDGGTHKFEPTGFQVFADPVGERRGCRNISHAFGRVDDGSAVDIGPQKAVKAAILFLNLQERFGIADGCVDFPRCRMIPLFARSSSTLASSYSATLCGSKPSNAVRKFSRFFSTVIHANPACIPSRINISNNLLSSWRGLPHSLSW